MLGVLVYGVSSLQSIMVSLNRSDYMLDQNEDGSSSLKQVEINTFSAAGFGATDLLPEVHRYVETCESSLNQGRVMRMDITAPISVISGVSGKTCSQGLAVRDTG